MKGYEEIALVIFLICSLMVASCMLQIISELRYQVRSRGESLRLLQINTEEDQEAKKKKANKLRQTLPLKVWKQEKNANRKEDSENIAFDPEIQSQLQNDENLHKNESYQYDYSKNTHNTIKECPICLADFDDGCVICSSLNPSCNHIFHVECMVEWLLEHDNCPCCRASYMDEKRHDKCKATQT